MGRANETYAINLTLFKYIGFYQMLDPDGPRVFGLNAFNAVYAALVVSTSVVTATGFVGFVFGAEHTAENSFQDMPLLFYIACISLGNFKLVTVMRNAGELWDSLDVAQDSFLSCGGGGGGGGGSGDRCTKYRRMLADCGARFARMFPWYYFLFFMTAFSWITLPIFKNRQAAPATWRGGGGDDDDDAAPVPKYNVINFIYPAVSTATYNANYGVLYAMEGVMCAYGAFGLVTFDLYLIAVLRMISTHYDIISSAYEDLEFVVAVTENGIRLNENIEEELRSITLDSQKLYKYLKKIYEISRPIALIYIIVDAVGMITMPYCMVLCYIKHGSIFNSDVLTFAWTVVVAGIQSYIYCSLFQNVTEKKEALSFGLYCSDWTWSDVQVKKQILSMMRLNDSNNLKMKATPMKLIDLPMLATLVKTSYNVTSVLINSNINKIKQSL